MTAPAQSPFMKHGPAIALVVLLAFLALGIYRKSSATTVPPFFDSLSYYTKSKRVWEQLHQKVSLRRTLNVEPVVRPPGCALIGYPFGFSNDYHGFYFRTVFAPIALWVLALWLIARQTIPSGANRWTAACLIGGFASFSMFYHFDYNPALDATRGFCHTWGMQDCVIASLGALATALVFLSARKQSIGLAFAGSIVGAWTLLIKPSGMLVMALVFWTWLIETAIRHWPLNRAWKNDRGFRLYAITTGSLLLLVFGSVFVSCIRSKYLSAENWKYMSGAVKILYSSLGSMLSLSTLDSWVSPTLGWHWFVFLGLAITALCVTWTARLFRGMLKADDWRLPAALLGFAGALYWWFFMAGLQVRYLFPFILVFLTAIFPCLLRLIATLRPWSCSLLGAVSIAPALLVSGAVLVKECPLRLQHALGISVTAGGYSDEVQIGNALVSEARTRQSPAIVYSFEADVSAGIVHGVGELANLAAPGKPGVLWYFAFDWTRGSLIRRTDLLNSGYVLFRPTGNAKALLSAADASDPRVEAATCVAWFEELDENAGVQVVLNNSIRLLRIVDRQKLNAAFEKLMSAHQWRELFTKENSLTTLSAMSHKFGASTETLFHASPDQNAATIRPNASLSVTAEAGRILLRVSGTDPALQLPEIEVPSQRNLIVRLCLTSPVPSRIEIRHAVEKADAPGTIRTIAQEIAVGENELYVLLPSEDGRIRITFHPAAWVEHLAIEDIEVRAVPQ